MKWNLFTLILHNNLFNFNTFDICFDIFSWGCPFYWTCYFVWKKFYFFHLKYYSHIHLIQIWWEHFRYFKIMWLSATPYFNSPHPSLFYMWIKNDMTCDHNKLLYSLVLKAAIVILKVPLSNIWYLTCKWFMGELLGQ